MTSHEIPQGLCVRYQHLRPCDPLSIFEPLPQGGRTVALLVDAEGETVARGEARWGQPAEFWSSSSLRPSSRS
jgi:hypothetical protein